MRTALIAASAALCCATVVLAADMTGDEFKAKLVGVEFTWKTTDGKYFGRSRYSEDGKVFAIESNVPKQKGTVATWRLDGNKVCIVNKAMGGQERCVTYEARPDGTFYSSSKTVVTLVK